MQTTGTFPQLTIPKAKGGGTMKAKGKSKGGKKGGGC